MFPGLLIFVQAIDTLTANIRDIALYRWLQNPGVRWQDPILIFLLSSIQVVENSDVGCFRLKLMPATVWHKLSSSAGVAACK